MGNTFRDLAGGVDAIVLAGQKLRIQEIDGGIWRLE
jgi:hypothetical protein